MGLDPRNKRAVQTAVFDGDDTLWETERLYDDARQAARSVVERSGLPGDVWEKRQRFIDVENVSILGFSPQRFPTSCAQAYEVIGAESGTNLDEAVRQAVYEAAASVFSNPASLVDGAEEVLTRLASDWRLILLTKGASEVQGRRIEESGLAGYFDEVRIVDTKTEDVWSKIIEEFAIDPAASWSIGNSLGSDIQPALSCGFSAIWIPAHVWEHEQHGADVVLPERTVRLSSLREVPSFLDSQERSAL